MSSEIRRRKDRERDRRRLLWDLRAAHCELLASARSASGSLKDEIVEESEIAAHPVARLIELEEEAEP